MSTICDDLRGAILQAAMQGKLTKQLPEDGDAEALLEQIAKEKEKISRKKKDLPISEDEILFEIPSSWRWQKLENISVFIGDKSNQIKESSVKKDGKYKVVSQSKELFIGYCDDDKKLLTIDDPVLVFGDHTALIKYINFDFIIGADGVKVIKPLCVNIRFLYYALKYNLIGVNELGGYSRHYKFIKDKLIPIPPLVEQKRIVEKVDELMARVADLEKSADALASLKSHYPDEMRTSLLQAAMQGKLTKQLPEDGDAEDLLEQIKAEKEKLVAEGKIKKQEALAPITDDEIPFSIPENWKWARLADLFQFINGDRGKNYPSKNKLHASGEIPFISAINMQNGTIREDNLLYADRPTYDKLGSGKLNKDDFVICIRGSLGKYCKYPYELGAIASSLIIARKYSSYILDDYIEAYLQSPLLVNEIHNKDNGTAQPNLSAADFIHFLTPVPPLAEQKRIAERLDALMQNINVVGDLTAREQS